MTPSPARRLVRRSGASVSVAMLLVLAVGCGRGEFEDRTARVEVEGRTTTFRLDSCGRDGQTLFVVGRSEDGQVLQAVVGLEDDLAAGVPDSTGLTVIDGDVELAAFGPEAWARRGEDGEAPGAIAGAGLRGSRIRASGRVVAVDRAGVPEVTGDAGTAFSLDARCDEQESPA